MSYLEHHSKSMPQGVRKLLYVHWPLVLLVSTVATIGFLMLYSVAGGAFHPWAGPQMQRFGLGLAVMFIFAMVPIWYWRNISALAYGISLLLLIAVEVMGQVGMGAQRWIDIGPLRLQPSELAKIGVVMALAAYFDWLPNQRLSHPIAIIGALVIIALPAGLTFIQPDLGTALLIMIVGAIVIFVAGVHWAYFAAVFAIGAGAITAVFQSRGTPWQLLKDYQYRRIDTFLDPSSDPLGAGYHITQSKIALGSGGWTGRGFMQGTQSRLNFLPEKHTDFIFTTLAEEFGFIGAGALLLIYTLIIVFCIFAALRAKDRYAALLTYGLSANFFLYFAVNMAMVMGLAPVVGVPLPLVSYGGSAMLVLMAGFGLIQSAHIHRPR